MPYKLVPTAYERVELTQEELQHKNAVRRKNRAKKIEEDPETYKAKVKEQNRRAYLRKKQRIADALAEQEQQSQHQPAETQPV
jgi:hypothetical protein